MFKIKRFSKVTSTNDIAKGLAKNGEDEGTVIIADAQECGRGRMGRAFFSPEGTGLYMSILLRPKFKAEGALLITTAAAVAVAEAVEKHTGEGVQIKWVNDVFKNGKKVCGILTEGSIAQNNLFEYAILGIGINLTYPKSGFGALESIAGAVFENDAFDRERFIGDILEGFKQYYLALEDKPHLDGYLKRDMLIGKEVDVISAGEVLYSAKVTDIDKDFALVIEHDGIKEALSSGEVSVKPTFMR